jgi:hypothetical protein
MGNPVTSRPGISLCFHDGPGFPAMRVGFLWVGGPKAAENQGFCSLTIRSSLR